MSLKRKLLSVVGMEGEPAPTAEDERDSAYEKQMEMAWQWLRSHALDRAIREFFETGRFDRLRTYAEGPAAERLCAHLSSMREQGIVWVPSSPEDRAAATVTIVSHNRDPKTNAIKDFVVQESFLDRSRIAYVDENGTLVEADNGADAPERRVMQAHVICDGPQSYKVHELRQVAVGV